MAEIGTGEMGSQHGPSQQRLELGMFAEVWLI
jgi:hypothetical protein